jgi:peptide/nickel transport system substrate-binding protein/oligopeptide transport system substrate-binding protein
MAKRSTAYKILLCTISIAALSCSRSNKNDFNTYIQSDPGILDPFISTDVVSGKVLATFCDGLLRISPAGSVEPDLLSDWNFDGTTFHGTLKSGLKFSDGTALSPSDVLYSFLRIRDSEKPTSPRRSTFLQIKQITADGNRLTIQLVKPNMTFPYILTQVNAYIISEKSMKEKKAVIGSGAFRVAQWIRDDRIVVERNPFFSGTPASVDRIIFRIIPEDLTARFEFLNHTIDYFELPYLSSAVFDSSKFRTELIPELCVHYIALNTTRYPFTDPDFRRALNLAVDRKAIVAALFGNRFSAAQGSVPPGIKDYPRTVKPYPYDPAKAKSEIERLGLKGRKITLNCKAEHQISLSAQMIQHYLEEAGLKVELHEMEWGALKNVTNAGRYDMAFFNWYGDYPDAENFLRPLFHSANKGSGGNRAFYANPAFDALIEKASLTSDSSMRNALYSQAERIAVGDAPWIFLWYGGRRLAFSNRVESFVSYPVYNGMKGNEIILNH